MHRSLHSRVGAWSAFSLALLAGLALSSCSGASTSSSFAPPQTVNAPNNIVPIQTPPPIVRLPTPVPYTPAHGKNLVNRGGPTLSGHMGWMGIPPWGTYGLVPVMTFNVLINHSDESPWGGKIKQFETELFSSPMIDILDQYLGKSATGNYAFGNDVTITHTIYGGDVMYSDLQSILQTIGQKYPGLGYQSIFNVFFDSSVTRICTDALNAHCYTPTQGFCATHGSLPMSGVYDGTLYYTIQPYQGVYHCNNAFAKSPNGQLIDPTASALSHEMFETFTDPIATSPAWQAQVYNPATGGNTWEEIGDICEPDAGITPGWVRLGADWWYIQSEYSNSVTDCTYDNVYPAY